MAKDNKPSKAKFVNPFEKGVTYEQFLKSVPQGVKVETHLKGKCSDAQIKWLSEELKQFKNNK